MLGKKYKTVISDGMSSFLKKKKKEVMVVHTNLICITLYRNQLNFLS